MQKINFLTAKLINNNYIKPNEKRLLSYANNKFYKNLQQNKITNIGKKTINTAIITTGLNITENIITSLYSYKNTQMGYYTPINSNEIKNLAQISERIKTANSREEYTTILAEIKSLPENKNKEILQKQAFDKYNSWLKKQDQEFDIRMEYTPKNKKNTKYELTNEEFENLKEKLKDKVPNDVTLNKSNILTPLLIDYVYKCSLVGLLLIYLLFLHILL